MIDKSDSPCIQVTSNFAILFNEGGQRQQFRRYVYDNVFDDSSSQEVVYQKTTAPLVRDVVNGFSAAVFAYGATGSGLVQFLLCNLIPRRIKNNTFNHENIILCPSEPAL